MLMPRVGLAKLRGIGIESGELARLVLWCGRERGQAGKEIKRYRFKKDGCRQEESASVSLLRA